MGWVVIVDGRSELADVFAGVVKVEDFDGIREGLSAVFSSPRNASSNRQPTDFLPEAPDGTSASGYVTIYLILLSLSEGTLLKPAFLTLSTCSRFLRAGYIK